MVRCQHCGRPIEGLPYRCKYCGGVFCVDCHLPEKHDCPGLQRGGGARWFPVSYADRSWELPEKPVEAPVSSRSRPVRAVVSPRRGRKMLYVVALLLAAAVTFLLWDEVAALMAGLVSRAPSLPGSSPYTRVTVEELVKHPELHVDERVEVEGNLGITMLTAFYTPVDVDIGVVYLLGDEQGYHVYVIPPREPQRQLYLGSVYTARGVLKLVKFKYLLTGEYVYYYILFAEEMRRKS